MAEYSLFKQRCQVHSWRSTVGGAAHPEQYGTQFLKQTQKRMEYDGIKNIWSQHPKCTDMSSMFIFSNHFESWRNWCFGGYIPPVSRSYGWKMLKNYGNWTMETNLGIRNKAYPESSFARITLFERSSYQTNLCHTTKQKSDHCFFRTTTNPWFVRHTVGKPSVLDVFDACQTCFEVGVSQSQQGRVPCLNSCAPT